MFDSATDEEARRSGARFFDARKRDQGLAGSVTRRPPGLNPLTVIDVVDAAPALFAFLAHLDKSQLLLRHPHTGATLYEFRWASGYADGSSVRIQGLLAPR
jgi:hypothetical protein